MPYFDVIQGTSSKRVTKLLPILGGISAALTCLPGLAVVEMNHLGPVTNPEQLTVLV